MSFVTLTFRPQNGTAISFDAMNPGIKRAISVVQQPPEVST